jgi:hypothetical protein
MSTFSDLTLPVPRDREAAVTPRVEAVRGEPVDPDVASAAPSPCSIVAEILQPGASPVMTFPPRGDHVGLARSGEEQELVELEAMSHRMPPQRCFGRTTRRVWGSWVRAEPDRPITP